jgi:hypothetical protein
MTKFFVHKGLMPAGLTALVLGGATLTTAAPALAQYGYDDGDRPRVERPIIERGIDRPDHGGRWDGRDRGGRWDGRDHGGPWYGRHHGGPWYGGRFDEWDCRVVVTRRINRFGERVIVRRRICG